MPRADAEARRAFRLDNVALAFRFTATLVDRHGARDERLTSPARLHLWLLANRLVPATAPLPSARQFDDALALREAVHRAGVAVATGDTPAAADVARLNAVAAGGRAHRVLEGTRAGWAWGADPITDALGIVASAAIETLGGLDRDRVRTCANPECSGLYVDTSRGRNRRWCSMSFCGNKAKKAALEARATSRLRATGGA